MNKEQKFIFEKYKENNPNAVSKEEYLEKLYDIKNTPLPVVIGRTGGGMSFNTKRLLAFYDLIFYIIATKPLTVNDFVKGFEAMKNNEGNSNFLLDIIPTELEATDVSTSAIQPIQHLSHLEIDLSSDKRSKNVVVLGKVGKGVGFKVKE